MKRILAIISGLSVLAIMTLALYSYHPEVSLDSIKNKQQYPDSQYIRINDMEVHYYDKGQGETLVLLHGNGGNIHHFDNIIASLSLHYRVIAMDYMGHGLTGADTQLDYSNENFIHFFERFFNALNLDNVNLVGNSMGGYWSMLYAMKHPARVNKIVLIGSYGGTCEHADYTPKFTPENLPMAETFSQYFLPAFVVKSELEKFFYSSSAITDTILNNHIDMFSIAGNRMYRKYFSAYPRPRELIKGNQLPHPILILWGEHDNTHNLCEAENLANRLHTESMVVLKNTGHIPMLERPKETEEAILHFLNTDNTN